VLSDSWETYPVLRFSEVPRVQLRLLDRPEAPPLGAGEASMGPTIAAIANALHQALGVRPARLPFTPENL
jgi:CO/xanthine dehydrogenase Mo-binding subunit